MKVNELNSMLNIDGILMHQYATNLIEIDSDNGLYKVTDDIYLMDTYGCIRTGTISGGNVNQINNIRKGTQNIAESPTSAAYSNMDVYPFGTKYTIVGKFLEGVFGDAHYKYFSNVPDRRLKVNFYNRNWLVYSSLTVRAVIQKKNFLGIWGPVDNMDEMRLGWTPIVIKLDIPRATVPNTIPSPDLNSLVGKLLKDKIKIKLGDSEYLTLKASSVYDAHSAFPFLYL
jgi:hypothetical protein